MEKNFNNNKDFITANELRQFLGGISRPTLWRYLKNGILPQPVKISKKLHLYDLDEVKTKLKLTHAPQNNSEQKGA